MGIFTTKQFMYSAALLMCCLTIYSGCISATELDLTRAVVEQTDIDEQARKLCGSFCTGNEKKSWLHKVVARWDDPPKKDGSTVVEVQVKMRNRHVWKISTPFGTERVTAYSDTAKVRFVAFFKNSNCTTQGFAVTSANEVYKVLGGFATLLMNNGPLAVVIRSKVPSCGL